MGLRNVVSALLPREYREQVLGDLQERGLRLSDIANVLPRVWWSHIARQGTLRHYALAEVSDAALELRTRQFHRATWWSATLWFTVLLGEFALVSWGPQQIATMLVLLALIAATFLIPVVRVYPAADRDTWRRRHYLQLSRERRLALSGMPFMLMLFSVLPTELLFLQPEPWLTRSIYIIAVGAISLAIGRLRVRRLQREIEGLS